MFFLLWTISQVPAHIGLSQCASSGYVWLYIYAGSPHACSHDLHVYSFHQATVAKTKIVGSKDTLKTLLQYIDIEQIPRQYGGKCSCIDPVSWTMLHFVFVWPTVSVGCSCSCICLLSCAHLHFHFYFYLSFPSVLSHEKKKKKNINRPQANLDRMPVAFIQSKKHYCKCYASSVPYICSSSMPTHLPRSHPCPPCSMDLIGRR